MIHHQRTLLKSSSVLNKILLSVVIVALGVRDGVHALGGEIAKFQTTPFTANRNISHRQNFCDRYQEVYRNNWELKDALNGVELHPVLQYGDAFPYFNYDPVTGIDKENPGLVAHILDYIAAQANFTWRNSFGVYTADDKGTNKTWTELLKWTTDTYDISIDKWAQSTERLNMGISFCEPWFDGSLIMIDKIEPPPDKNKVNYGNWLRPFDTNVWIVTIATIIFSCFVYQFLEALNDERDERSHKQWFMDNFYLSAINFTQNYTYEPKSISGRIFGISFAFWTMLIGATYTANLASLLVEREIQPTKIADIEEGIARGYRMCTFDSSFSDFHIKRQYGQAIRVPKMSPEDMYAAVNNDECDILIGAKQAWTGFQSIESYNPNCDLEWVGRQVQPVVSAFATKVDPGVHCTGLINEVFNYYLSEMKDNKFFDDQWDLFNAERSTPDFSCAAKNAPDDGRRRRNLAQKQVQQQVLGPEENSLARNLKGGGGGGGAAVASAAAAGGGDDSSEGEESLTLNQMAGTFLLHCIGSVLAIVVALISSYAKEKQRLTFKGRNKERNKLNSLNSGSATGVETSSSDGQMRPNIQSQIDELAKSQVELSGQMSMVIKMLNHIQCQLDDTNPNDGRPRVGRGRSGRRSDFGGSVYQSAKGSMDNEDINVDDPKQNSGGAVARIRSFFY